MAEIVVIAPSTRGSATSQGATPSVISPDAELPQDQDEKRSLCSVLRPGQLVESVDYRLQELKVGFDLGNSDDSPTPSLSITCMRDRIAAVFDLVQLSHRLPAGDTALLVDAREEVLLANQGKELSDLRRGRAGSLPYLQLDQSSESPGWFLVLPLNGQVLIHGQ